MARLFLVTDRSEIDRRRRLLNPGEVVEVWEALHAPDVAWLGDPELRRIAYQRAGAAPTPGLFWLGESAKAALDRVGPPLPHLLAVPGRGRSRLLRAVAPRHRGPSGGRVAQGTRAVGARHRGGRATYDHPGARLEYQPADPLGPVFYLRRARAKAVHAWRLFRSRQEAVQYATEMLKGDEDAARWAETFPAQTSTTWCGGSASALGA